MFLFNAKNYHSVVIYFHLFLHFSQYIPWVLPVGVNPTYNKLLIRATYNLENNVLIYLILSVKEGKLNTNINNDKKKES